MRDLLLGRESKDIDIVTDARPEEVLEIFPEGKPIGKAFGVILVHLGHHDYEIATFRRDAEYRDGRHPVAVEFATAAEDAGRRDFTINAMFYDPLAERVIDHVGGRADLKARVVRCVGDPERRFAEDHLRLLRAVRFASVLEFALDPATAEAIRRNAASLRRISAERIRVEMSRLLVESSRAGRGVRLLREVGLLGVALPEVDALAGVEQPPEFHPEGDVFEHTCRMLDFMVKPDLVLAWSALLHDVGKPGTARLAAGGDGAVRWRFHGHDKAGAEVARAVLERLRFSKRQTEDIVYCVANHMRFMHVRDMRRPTLRRLLAAPTFETELELHRLDCLSSKGDLANWEFLRREREVLRHEVSLPRALIRGEDVMALGVPQGAAVGRWVKAAYEAQLEHAGWGRAALLAWLKKAMG